MGYTTDFRGQFNLDKPLTQEHKSYLELFARTRRMKRSADAAEKLDDPIRIAAGLPIGDEGAYFVGATDEFGQDTQRKDKSVLDHNEPPAGQPSLWCQWIPNCDGTAIEWDGGEKFYEYTTWIKYIIENFLKPWGYVLSGEVEWRGESWDDRGFIIVEENKVRETTKA